MLVLKCKKLSEKAILPIKAHDSDACFDLFVDGKYDTISISPGEVVKIHTGISTEIPHGWYATVYARSGLSTKQGLRLANNVGIIDEDYRGEWIIALYNDSSIEEYIHGGQKIAQFTLVQWPVITIEEVDQLSSTERGEGGFGSTGN